MGDRDLGTDRREDTLEAIFTRSVTINSKEWLATAQPFAKMKGLKISQPQSVARIDHTSFLCERSLLPLSLSLSLSLPFSRFSSIPAASNAVHLPFRASLPYGHRRNTPFFNLPHLRFGRACFLVAPASGLETHRLRDSCENSVKKLASSPTTSTGSDRPR